MCSGGICAMSAARRDASEIVSSRSRNLNDISPTAFTSSYTHSAIPAFSTTLRYANTISTISSTLSRPSTVRSTDTSKKFECTVDHEEPAESESAQWRSLSSESSEPLPSWPTRCERKFPGLERYDAWYGGIIHTMRSVRTSLMGAARTILQRHSAGKGSTAAYSSAGEGIALFRTGANSSRAHCSRRSSGWFATMQRRMTLAE
mmetsp:Transcript_18534/g.49084  ORF Transcript_18534/g.49084 Transcript_18534/m.49084 type:complete len:204 (+) Transcript_18534:2689-3300(+)